MVITHRLRSSADIRRTVALRQAAGSATVVVHVRIREDGLGPRVAIVAGRRVGNAVARNRAKRRLRAIVHDLALTDDVDVVISAKLGADAVPYLVLAGDLRGCIRRAMKRVVPAALSTT